jgi:hypothetical protein
MSLPQVEELAHRRQAVFQYVKSAQTGSIFYLNTIKLSPEDVSVANRDRKCEQVGCLFLFLLFLRLLLTLCSS